MLDPTSSLLKNSIHVLRQAQHERKTSVNSIATPFVLRLSKDERRVFQQTAREYLENALLSVDCIHKVIHAFALLEMLFRLLISKPKWQGRDLAPKGANKPLYVFATHSAIQV